MAKSVNGDKATTTLDENVRDETRIERRFAAVLKADRASLRNAGAGIVFAAHDVSVERAGARDIIAGGDATIRQGGGAFIAALGRIDIDRGGAGMIAAGNVSVGRGAIVGLAITPRLKVAEGGKLLGGPVAGIAALSGVALGIVIGAIASRRR